MEHDSAPSGCVHRLTSSAGRTTVRGTLSTSQHVFWALVDGVPVASGTESGLRALLGAGLDVQRLALGLCSNVPARLRLRSHWTGVRTVSPGATLVLRADGGVAEERVALDEVRDDTSPEEAAGAVRAALDETLRVRTQDHGTISCDLSGGVDSTTLAYLLDRLRTDVSYTRASTDDPTNVDRDWAAHAATGLRGPLVELESFSRTTSAFAAPVLSGAAAAAEAPPAWGSNAAYLEQALLRARGVGAGVHVNGLGGDELFAAAPAVALAVGRRRPARAARAVLGLGTMQRWPLGTTVRAALSREPYGRELRRRVRGPARGAPDGPAEAFSWAPGFAPTPFLSPAARAFVTEAVEAVTEDEGPLAADRARHQVLEAVVFQGEVTRQGNDVFRDLGVSWESPFLDERLVTLVLSLPGHVRAAPGPNKPLLAAAVHDVVPSHVFAREHKGEYSQDLFDEYRRERGALHELLLDGALVAAGLVDAGAVRRALGVPVTGTAQLFEVEHLVRVERWARGAVA
ncbi:asparagine synthase-related protein [Cellulosimicrobium sp. PMB13]|uniref:asparagine synthase-related protein n=1 Tax=Cellulosimicrobium sp. PMB13 TaxID=3120158 RepID=UPI003F4B1818